MQQGINVPKPTAEWWSKRDWDNRPILPVYNAASFDTGHTLEQRVANYKRLRELAVSFASKHPVDILYYLHHNPEFFSRRPTLEEIRRCWDIGSFRGSVEKANSEASRMELPDC